MTIHDEPGHVTRLLRGWLDGQPEAQEQLWGIVYAELKSLARHVRRGRGPARSLSTTDLVHEAYLKLIGNEKLDLKDRRHFFAVAARAMRFVLVDSARKALAARRGGGQIPLPLDETIPVGVKKVVDLVALDDALTHLKEVDFRKHEAVELAYFGGLTYDEIGVLLTVSAATVKRDLTSARIWLLARMRQPAPG